MRRKIDTQLELDFQASNLPLTNAYFAKYKAISCLLLAHPELVECAHRDLKHALEGAIPRGKGPGRFRFTTDQVLRILLCQRIESMSLREIVVRIDDSRFLRQFVRIGNGPMMDFSTLCKLRTAIQPKTWENLNRSLARIAVQEGRISGKSLRLDTTAVETNIHWPADSSLLWDSYRSIARLIQRAREIDPMVVGHRRLHLRRVQRRAVRIARKAHVRGQTADRLKGLYEALIRQIESICSWATDIAVGLQQRIREALYDPWQRDVARAIIEGVQRHAPLAKRVAWQAKERVLQGRAVPNDRKVFSIFEEHTELLLRGKAGKDVEFGHMIQIQQVDGCFISDYAVFRKRPVENTLLKTALHRHQELFGRLPQRMAADRAYWSAETILELRREIEVVSIPKSGRPTAVDPQELEPLFRHAQRFRAGVEGTISYLKRVLGLQRCLAEGWAGFASTVAATIFAHNLLVLTRH